MRVEYAWSLLVAIVTVFGALAWTAASRAPAVPGINGASAESWRARPWSSCCDYEQYEFKVGRLRTPACLSEGN